MFQFYRCFKNLFHVDFDDSKLNILLNVKHVVDYGTK